MLEAMIGKRAGGLGVNRIILGVLGLVHKGCGLKG